MKSGAKLKVRVIPNAKKTEFTGFREDELVLRLSAPALEGKANKAATEYVARYFGVPRSAVSMLSGEKSRHKIFQIVGLESSDLEGKLSEFRFSSIDSP
jgi:uncharacterized protein (TIGR00251 family)